MTRARSLTAIVAGSLAWAAITACNQQTIETPLRSFDAPSDVALTCVHYFPNPDPAHPDETVHGTYNVRPLADCQPVAAQANVNLPTYTLPYNYVPVMGGTSFTPFLVALVPQAARGELALVDTAREKLIDLDPFTPGFGFVPVGKQPEHIRSSPDGCWAVTSNSSSCDLSRIDISRVVHSAALSLFPAELANGTSAIPGVTELPLTVPSASGTPKRLYARPAWIEMAPEHDLGGEPSTHGYENGGTPGLCSGGDHRAWVALPACQLVVKVHLEADPLTQPTIEAALHVDKSGVTVVSDLSTIDCPVECAGDNGVAPADLGAPVTATPTDMGPVNLPTAQAWPSAIAVDAETDVSGVAHAGRLLIGDGYGERIDVVPFDIAAGTFGQATSVTLDPGDLGLAQPGVRVLRVGPRSQAGKFLYAVARDGSVRVIDLDRNAECETNPDPRWTGPGVNLQETPSTMANPLPADPLPEARRLGCFPLGDPSTPRRSPLATSPGISLAAGQLPTDVAFVHIDAPPGDPTHTLVPSPAAPGLVVGDFAFIITSDGKGTVVNIFDACPAPNQQSSMTTSPPYGDACVLANVAESRKETVAQFGHPEPMLLDRVSHRIRAGHPRFFLPASESDTTGQPRVADSTNPCAITVPPTSPGVPDGGVPDAGGCGTGTGNLPSLYQEQVPAALAPVPSETRVIYFVDPDHVRNETWVLSWEGTLAGTDRDVGTPLVIPNSGTPGVSAYVSDAGGAWCSRGVLAGDKLVFRGCTVDSECDQAASFACVHDPGAFADVSQGMCLKIDKTHTIDQWSQSCGKLLRSQRKFRVLSARQHAPIPNGSGTTDLLAVGEIYEPEYAEETGPCATDDDCKAITVTTQGANPMPSKTTCLADADGQKRCLLPCTDETHDDECGVDFECAKSAFGDKRCVRAPIGDQDFWATCMPEVQEYELHAGSAFTVSGTSSGFLSNEIEGPDGECMVPPETLERVRLSQWRVPLKAAACPANVNQSPLAASIDPAVMQTNVCEVSGGAGTRNIHFENPIFNIVVQLPLSSSTQAPQIPPDGTALSFAVTGGAANLQTLLGVDVQAQQPTYATVAPDGQTVYIIDEGKSPLATGLRGQLLRLFSGSQSVDTTFYVR